MRLECGDTHVVCSSETVTDPYVPTHGRTKRHSALRSQEDGEVWQDLSAGKSVVDALLAPTSPHEVGRATAVDSVACPSTFKLKWAAT